MIRASFIRKKPKRGGEADPPPLDTPDPTFPDVSIWAPNGDWWGYLSQFKVGDYLPVTFWCFNGVFSDDISLLIEKPVEDSTTIIGIKDPTGQWRSLDDIADIYFWWSWTASLDFFGAWGKWTRFFETNATHIKYMYKVYQYRWTKHREIELHVNCEGLIEDIAFTETPPGDQPPSDAEVSGPFSRSGDTYIRDAAPGDIANPEWSGAVDFIQDVAATATAAGYDPSITLIKVDLPDKPAVESEGTVRPVDPTDELGTSYEAIFENFNNSTSEDDVVISALDVGTNVKGQLATNAYIAGQGGDYSVGGIPMSIVEDSITNGTVINPDVFIGMFGDNIVLPPGVTGIRIVSINVDADVGTSLDVDRTAVAHPLVTAGDKTDFGNSTRGTITVDFSY